ncbi:hypothetical protein SAMN05421820_104184 [Pedobacter steynii]|uniref:HNH domain-containing protein n=1 Tax=Pedobacter steynii TaxID=430522 RepID=A0A1G9UIM2_9SPHI|nr:HNH endonuclease signature motif containing protein [Pedobacter steynii]NQX40779.1 HNH endonuclease [Pedobacter steynii]SDM59771.1 hypothetical protein SAMN05421820_104184 [Pedobacter steynii]
MKNKFRDTHPKRTCLKKYANYGDYKPYLANDFFKRCGYTDCSDFWFGGTNNFHIDHFVPWKKYPSTSGLKTDYENLVYCCSYVNILKSDDETNYIDPCNVDFNNHFSRSGTGAITPNSPTAQYMYKKLKLFMQRYEIIWMLDELLAKMKRLAAAISDPKNSKLKTVLQVAHSELSVEMTSYLDYLRASQ